MFQGRLDCDGWDGKIHRFLAAVVWRIERLKGRLKPVMLNRSQWELKSLQLKTEMENAPHLR